MALVTPAFAQDAGDAAKTQAKDDLGDSEIIVTAQRTAQSVQDVPIPITVVGADQLRAQGVQEINDLGRTVSSLKLAENPGGSGGGGYIRGVGTFSRSRAAEPSVGIVVDGVVQGLTNIRNLSDVARVEVLRGPQGTLFGQSVSAGVINITTIAPDYDKFSGTISTELSFDDFAGSNYGKQQIRAAVNVPIAGFAGLRVSGYGVRTQGVLENIYLGNKDYRREWGVRGRFKAELAPGFTLNLAAEYNSEDRGNGYFLALRDTGLLNAATGTLTQPAPPAGVVASNYDRVRYCGVNPNINNFEICSDAPSAQTYRTQGYSGEFDLDLGGGLSLTSITAYRKLATSTQNDIDNLPEALDLTSVHSGLTSDYDQFTQEIRLASDMSKPLSFTLGGFYFISHVDSVAGPSAGAYTRIYTRKGSLPIATCFPVSTNALCNTFIVPGAYDNFQSWYTRNTSVFGELRYHPGQFTVFAGGRYNIAKVGFDGTTVNTANNATTTASMRLSDNDFSWRIGAEYEIDRNLMLFSTVSRGYKNAQISPLQNTTPAQAVSPEIPTSFEAGIKSSWLNGRLLVNLSAFYTSVKNYQGSRCDVDIATQSTTCNPFNIPKIITKGIEGDIFGRVGDHLKLNASFTFNPVLYPDNFLAQDGTNMGGTQLADAARFTASFYGDYDFALTSKVDGFLGFDISYKSEERLSDLSNSRYFIYKGHAIVGARVGAKMGDSWRLALFVNNLFNQNSPQQFASLANQDTTRAPNIAWGVYNTSRGLRQVGLQASLNF
ncbi:TonB-dependent receptor [Sphingomonas sp.]|uniref:TonB-dependent receptor n=1 Tax=Sphingomonas sp. TaxID=28214 RepID=UPI001ED11FDC|nr:TonB-dependent receptor [Sphingomonas sp.]MBX3592868.1 TonB-dependent receptor [Sphingomonas sp.]